MVEEAVVHERVEFVTVVQQLSQASQRQSPRPRPTLPPAHALQPQPSSHAVVPAPLSQPLPPSLALVRCAGGTSE